MPCPSSSVSRPSRSAPPRDARARGSLARASGDCGCSARALGDSVAARVRVVEREHVPATVREQPQLAIEDLEFVEVERRDGTLDSGTRAARARRCGRARAGPDTARNESSFPPPRARPPNERSFRRRARPAQPAPPRARPRACRPRETRSRGVPPRDAAARGGGAPRGCAASAARSSCGWAKVTSCSTPRGCVRGLSVTRYGASGRPCSFVIGYRHGDARRCRLSAT